MADQKFPLYEVLTDAYSNDYAARGYGPGIFDTTESYLPRPENIAAVTALFLGRQVTSVGMLITLTTGFATDFNHRTGMPDYNELITAYGSTVGRTHEAASERYSDRDLTDLLRSYEFRTLVGTRAMKRRLAIAHLISVEAGGLLSTLVYPSKIATGDPEKMVQFAHGQLASETMPDDASLSWQDVYDETPDVDIARAARAVDASVTCLLPNVLALEFMAADFYAPKDII